MLLARQKAATTVGLLGQSRKTFSFEVYRVALIFFQEINVLYTKTSLILDTLFFYNLAREKPY